MILGAILAGGKARRFGSDKAVVEIHGVAILDRVARALTPQCDAMIVVGRDWPGLTRVEDRPHPGLGPLGGLAGALGHAAQHGFSEVLTSGCDLPEIPFDLRARFGHGPSVMAGQPLLGLWPVDLAPVLIDHLRADNDRSLRGWVTRTGAQRVDFGRVVPNINTPGDLAAYEAMRVAGPQSSP